MAEAVIVSTARTPIGRAFKGSLKEMRPDDLSVQVIRAALAKVPGARPDARRGPLLGLRRAVRPPRLQHGPRRLRAGRLRRAARARRSTGSAPRRVQTTRMAYHAIKAGEGDVFLSGGVECVSQYTSWAGAGGSAGDDQNPAFAPAQERSAATAASNDTWHDPREDGLVPDVYLSMGQTAENVATLRGVSRERQDEWGVTSQNRAEKAIADGFFEREIAPVTLPDGTVVTPGRRPARRGHARGRGAAAAGLPRAGHDHRRQLLPAQRRCGRGRRHERHPGRRAGPDPAGPRGRPPGSRPSRPRSWGSARSRPPARRWRGPA